MAEQPVSRSEVDQITKESDLAMGAGHIALGYLVTLRESGDKEMNLTKLHKAAVGKLLPGSDYEGYVKLHGEAFEYLKNHAQELGIKVD